MARYSVRLHTRAGVHVEDMEAKNAREAEVRAAKLGSVISVKRVRVSRRGGLSYGDRQILLSRLSAMLASRVGATDALSLMRDTFTGRIRHVSHELLIKVQAGASIPAAIVAQGARDFPPTVAAMIEAGANSGATPQALRDAGAFERHLYDIRRTSARGVWSALLSFLVGIIFVVATVFFMVPRIMESPLMTMTGGAEQFAGSIRFAYGVGYVTVAVLICLAALGLLGTVGRAISPVGADAIILRIPFYKDVVLSKSHFVSFYGLGLLVKAGVRMESAFDLLAGTTPAGALREDFLRARDAVKNGSSWANAMRTLQPTDRAALGASLDRTQVSEAMEAISIAYRDLYAQRVAALAPVLQTLAALGLILSGLLMFGLTILPVMQMSTKILQ
jgi:general secretion pathway protein F